MNDCFALLGLARRPLLDPQQLKAAYHRLAADWHPDAAGGDAEKFRALQESYQTLREPASRLRHLRALLQGPGADASPPSASLGHSGLFMNVGAVMQDQKAFQKRYESARSSLAKAVLHQEKRDLQERVVAARAAVEAALSEEMRALEEMDARWPEVSAEELLTLSSGFRFLGRWQSELAEAGFGLQLEG